MQGAIIWFHFDEYIPILQPEYILDSVADMLLSNRELRVQVNGHACSIGSDGYNRRLALKRANAVADLLVAKGVNKEQLIVASFGAAEPFRYNGKHQLATDRRVEIIPVGFYQPEEETQEEDDYIVITHNNYNNYNVNYEQYTSFIGEDKLKRGEHIATLARKWYDDPYYWVFIYEANADKIADPNHVKAGLTLMIPDLTERLAGLSDEQAEELALKLKRIYVNGESFDENNY
mgnify:CR=1 FL=1